MNEINKTDSKYDDIQRKIQREMLEYTKLQNDLDILTEKIEEYRKMKGKLLDLSKITIISYKLKYFDIPTCSHRDNFNDTLNRFEKNVEGPIK